jgi:hypothetical protein
VFFNSRVATHTSPSHRTQLITATLKLVGSRYLRAPPQFMPVLTTAGVHAAFDADGTAHVLLLPFRADGSADAEAAAELLKGDFSREFVRAFLRCFSGPGTPPPRVPLTITPALACRHGAAL